MNRLPAIIPSIYLALVILACLPIFLERDALSGVFAVLLVQPWATILGKFLDPSSGSAMTGLVIIAIGAILNAAILYAIIRFLVGLKRG